MCFSFFCSQIYSHRQKYEQNFYGNVKWYCYLCFSSTQIWWWQFFSRRTIESQKRSKNYVNVLEYQFKYIPCAVLWYQARQPNSCKRCQKHEITLVLWLNVTLHILLIRSVWYHPLVHGHKIDRYFRKCFLKSEQKTKRNKKNPYPIRARKYKINE